MANEQCPRCGNFMPDEKRTGQTWSESITDQTVMIPARSWPMEFVRSGPGHRDVSGPPWYVIRMTGDLWGYRAWYWWHDYMGPPVVFLTRKRAEERAKELRKQYRLNKRKVEVVRLEPER